MPADPGRERDGAGDPGSTTGFLGLAVATGAVAVLWAILLRTQPFGGVLGAATVTAMALAALAVVVAVRDPSAPSWELGHDTWLALPVLAVHLLASYLLIPVAAAVVPLVGRQADQVVFTATSDLPPFAVALVAAAVVAPLEELWWRGTLQPLIRQADGSLLANSNVTAGSRGIGLTTLAFAAFHLPTGQLPLIGAALLGGLAWGWLRERTEGLLAPVLAHAGWTAAMVLAPPG